MMTTEHESAVAVEPAGFTPWSEERAQQIATANGLGELSEAHWKVIRTLREHYVQYGAMPPMGLACGMNSLDAQCAEKLFHSANEVWQVAGLPEPGSEAVADMWG